MAKTLGELMVERGLASADQVKRLLARHRADGGMLGTLAINDGIISPGQLKRLLAEQAGVDPVPDDFTFLATQADLLPVRLAKKYGVVPLKSDGRRLGIGTAEPQNLPMLDELAFATGREIVPFLMLEMELADALDVVYPPSSTPRLELTPEPPTRGRAAAPPPPPPDSGRRGAERPRPQEAPVAAYAPGGDSPAARLVTAALEREAEVIHLQYVEGELTVRLRRPGGLEPLPAFHGDSGRALVNQLKVLAGLTTAERGQSQAGRFRLQLTPHPVTVAAHFTPTLRGERVTLRLESYRSGAPTFAELAVPEKLSVLLREKAEARHGLILLSGPPFSRRRELAYALLGQLDPRRRAILTVEDQGGFTLPGVDTLRPQAEEHLHYAAAVKAALEQDPDILFVDSPAGQETAAALVNAAFAQQLVILRQNASSLMAALLALRELSREPFLLAGSLALVVSQRELRTLCPKCKRPYQATKAVLDSLHLTATRPFTFYEATGCDACDHGGVSGSITVYEHLEPNAQIRQLLSGELNLEEFSRALRRAGWKGLRETALELALAGTVSVAELLRAT